VLVEIRGVSGTWRFRGVMTELACGAWSRREVSWATMMKAVLVCRLDTQYAYKEKFDRLQFCSERIDHVTTTRRRLQRGPGVQFERSVISGETHHLG
jgi:hypothetical protein